MPFRSVTHEGITLLCFPPYDTVFTRVAMDQLAALAASGRPTPPALEAALRSRFPRTTVRPRSSLAALLPGEAWYVYRDGRYSPFPDGDPWWERPGTAWIEIDDAGRYCDANEAALALIGADRDVLATLSTGDLADPAVRGSSPGSGSWRARVRFCNRRRSCARSTDRGPWASSTGWCASPRGDGPCRCG